MKAGLRPCPLTGKSPHTRCKCQSCLSERARVQRAYRKTNPNHVRAMNLRKHGLTSDEFDDRLAQQKGVCAVCAKPQSGHNQFGSNSLCVDHDHTTGQIRGLLCNPCNRALGFLRDSSEIIENLLEYRRKYDE